MKALLSHKLYLITIIAAVIVGLTTTGYFFYQYQKVRQQLKNPTLFTQEETKKVIDQLGKLMELPPDEIPTVATISDRDKLGNQPFFQKAKNGDKLIIYQSAKKAILYDPATNKIIDVAPINVSTATATPQTPAQTVVRTALYNGTETVGITRNVEQDLKAKMENVDIALKENAKKRDYAQTLVVDLTGSKKEVADKIAKILNAQVSTLPAGEEKPVASISGQIIDFLVIVGKDYLK